MNVSGKLYRYILNKRLTEWVETNGIISEAQAGFRRRHSAIDHICMVLIQKQLLKHGKLYVAFIDLKRAFDFVHRSCLCAVLRKNGLGVNLVPRPHYLEPTSPPSSTCILFTVLPI